MKYMGSKNRVAKHTAPTGGVSEKNIITDDMHEP